MAAEQQIGQIRVVESEPRSQEDVLATRFSGVLMGGAIADALGWPTEFARTPEDLERVGVPYPIRDLVPWHKRTGGRFFTRIDNIQPGDYSDDTQLTLSVARSLNRDGTVDNEYFAKLELRYWLDFARGAGSTVTAAAKAAARGNSDWRWNFFRFKRGRHIDLDYRGAGANGAAMRVAPIAVANLYDPRQTMIETWKNAIVTHGHARAIMGAVVYAEALRTIINNAITERGEDAAAFVEHLCTFVDTLEPPVEDPDVRFWLSRWNAEGARFEFQWRETKVEMTRMLRMALAARKVPVTETYRDLGCFEPATKGSGTVAAAAAIALFLREGKNFERVVLEAANMLGSDTDTIGAMVASLAGGWLGYTELPERWASMMADYTYINRVAETVTIIALRHADTNPLRQRVTQPAPHESLLDALKRQDVVERRRYWHPLLGGGRVTKVESQEVGRPKVRGRVTMATMQFDMGQTCKFSSYLGMPLRSGAKPWRSRRTDRLRS
jgi:ADP-ribosylglycohydrolase